MKRVVKHPDVRRQEILAAAEKLFKKTGYEKTSIEAIIDEAGIAKGTFYYYFKAKKDILRALVERISKETTEYLSSIVDKSNLSAIEKLQFILNSPKKRELINSPVMQIIHLPENRELQEQLNIQSIKVIAPLITKILVQGYHEGTFKKLANEESVQLILAASQFILESGLFEWSEKKRITFLKSLQNFLENLVGAKENLLDFISKK